MQKHIEAVPTPEEPWESGALGRDEEHVQRAPAELKELVDDAVGMQMISIRLQRTLIAELKAIADYRGIGYQPLIRDALQRFTRSELLTITIELQEKQKAMEALHAEQAAAAKRA